MVLLIDGNFFVNRVRSAIEVDFITNPIHDKQLLLFKLTESLCSQIRRLPVVTKIIITKDFGSWRKDHNTVMPTGKWKEDKDPTYKANRDKEKLFDAKAFFACYEDWLELLESKLSIPVIKTYKAEADDICSILAKVYSKHGINVILWTSDGDYVQNLNKNVFLLKFPQRYLYIDNSLSGLTQGLFNMNENLSYDTLKSTFKKSEIVFTNPIASILTKIVYGDSKDNVPPSFFWLTDKGARKRPSSSFVEKAFDEMLINPDKLTSGFLYDNDLIRKFYMHLLYVTKQTIGIDFKAKSKTRECYETPQILYDFYDSNSEATQQLEHTLKVYASNMKMKLLDFNQIPENIVQDVMNVMKTKSKLEHNIDLLKNFDKTAKILGLSEPEKQSNFFEKFNLAQVKADANEATANDQLSAITSSEPQVKVHNPLDDIMNELNSNLLNI